MVLIHLDLNFDLGVTLPRIHFEIIRVVFESSNDLPSRAGVRKLVEKKYIFITSKKTNRTLNRHASSSILVSTVTC